MFLSSRTPKMTDAPKINSRPQDGRSSAFGPAAGSAACAHPLAHKSGPQFMIGFFLHTGAMCPKCAYGTRVKSKRWAVCKKCGQRIERHALPNIAGQTGPQNQ